MNATLRPPPVDRLARNLELGGGRYALYPPPQAFRPFSDSQFTTAVHTSNGDPIPALLALHFDVPAAYRSSFCRADSPIRIQDRNRADTYCDRLVREIGLVGSLFDRDRDVVEVHLAPGMTRWLNPAQVGELLESLGRHFHLRGAGGIDLAMTLDLDAPAPVPLRDWVKLGFNRISVSSAAIADSVRDSQEQASEVARLVERVHSAGIANLRIEVPYGLAGQSDRSFEALIAAVIAGRPERIGLRYCAQSESDDFACETASRHMAHARMLLAGADALETAGYLHIGVDVFARANDPLVAAQHCNRIHRDALGFGTHGTTDLIGFGVGAISQLGSCHAQNPRDQATWESRIDRGQRAVDRGIELQEDDQIRATVLQNILCHGRINTAKISALHGIDFGSYFAIELERLGPLFEDESLSQEQDAIMLDRVARLSSRAVARHFDPDSTPLSSASVRPLTLG